MSEAAKRSLYLMNNRLRMESLRSLLFVLKGELISVFQTQTLVLTKRCWLPEDD